ncbi:MAG: hypothetical protein KDB53_02200 [Planctomycetes bacterium]|nr:hypothetical protein [Planctomycetota bacterium]
MSDEFNVERLVENFTGEDAHLLCFAWNGEHGDQFIDKNVELRREVLDHVLNSADAAPIDLLRCVFEAETRYSREAWSVHRDIHLLGEALLRAGEERVVLEFLRGKSRSFDTHLGCARSRVDPELAHRLAVFCRGVFASDGASTDIAQGPPSRAPGPRAVDRPHPLLELALSGLWPTTTIRRVDLRRPLHFRQPARTTAPTNSAESIVKTFSHPLPTDGASGPARDGGSKPSRTAAWC